MRFLMLNWRDPRNPRSGGAERVTLGYLAALARRGHEVFWFTYDFEGAAPVETLEGVTLVRGGEYGTSLAEAVVWCRTQKPFDLVIDQHHGIPWAAPLWCGTNCVAYIHEVLGPIWTAFYPWPLSVIGQWQERWTHRLYRNIPFWTASQCTREALRRNGVRDVTLIPYGVHTVALPELDDKPLGPPLRLAVVCRLAPNKRVDHALRAMKCLADRGVDVEAKVVGTGEVAGSIHKLAGDLGLGGRVTFTGPLPEAEKDAVLRGAHVLLHTSQREGWGLNVIEANAMGTPAVVYPVAGLIESTLHGQTGLVAAKETPEALAGSLETLLRSPSDYQRFRVNAWERAKTFHWSQVLPRACDWLENQARRGARAQGRGPRTEDGDALRAPQGPEPGTGRG
jgi:glycosyltransferase involved in cell wall biosynthesis